MLKWMPMPVRPTRQNSRKRAETASLVSFAVTSAAKSSAILESSLLSPCWRSRKVDGSSIVRRLPRAVARMSSRILKPCELTATARWPSKRIAPDHEMAAHRIGRGRCRAGGAPACSSQRLTRERCFESPAAEPPYEIAARDRHIGASRAQRFQHRRPAIPRHAEGRRPSRPRSGPGSPACPRGKRRPGRAGRCGGCSGRGCRLAPMARAAAAVPSGELSSTKITSQSHDVRSCASRSTRSGILAFSLKVGTTMVSSGAGRTAALSSARRGCADGLTGAMSLIADCGNAVRLSH